MTSLTTAAADLEERIRRHSEAFTQLLNLIPAKNYFSIGDGSTQWNKRKQTKEESQRAKKAKLDPDAIIATSNFGRQHLNLEATSSPSKGDAKTVLEVREGNSSAAEEAVEHLTKRQKKQQKKDARAAAKVATAETPKPAVAKGGNKQKSFTAPAAKEASDAVDSDDPDGDAEEIHLSGFTFSTDLTALHPPPTPIAPVPSSAVPPSTPKPSTPTSISPEKRLEQKARLEARIQQLRAQRNADSPDGTPARNRNELMAARRKEEAQARKERKKEMRMKKREKAVVGSGEVVVGTPVPGTPVRGTPGPAAVTPASGPGAPAPAGGEKVKVKEKTKEKKKSRPGFEGSIKAGKGGSGKKGRK